MGGRPRVALVDFHLRGENSYTLIAQLRQEGIPVIMLSGSVESSAPALLEGVMMLEKPVREEQMLEHLRPIAKSTTKIATGLARPCTCSRPMRRGVVPVPARLLFSDRAEKSIHKNNL